MIMFSGSPPNAAMLSLAHSTLVQLELEARVMVLKRYVHQSSIMEPGILACSSSAGEAEDIETIAVLLLAILPNFLQMSTYLKVTTI